MNALKNLSLLYVEDEPDTLKLYLRYFELYFDVVYTAQDGRKALEIYDEYKPDVIILDINIPYISGIEIAQKIRKTDSQTKIIMLTSSSDKQTFLKVVELGLTTFLEKPVSRGQLIEAFDKLKINQKKIIYEENDIQYSWDAYAHALYNNDKKIKLTKNEIKLLALFMKNININLSYQTIYEEVWFDNTDKEFSGPAIKTLIQGLRLKLPSNIINNVYGIGYSLNISI